MGIGPRWTCGETTAGPTPTTWNVNPDAKNFVLEYALELDEYLIVQVRYPNCINFEGNKVMVYKGVTLKKFKTWKEVDPHFKDANKTSPIARFLPTKEGWNMATRFVYAQLKHELDNT